MPYLLGISACLAVLFCKFRDLSVGEVALEIAGWHLENRECVDLSALAQQLARDLKRVH